jgi:hypothetical protein
MAAGPGSSQSRLCLKALAPHTVEVMRELGTTTSEDIATMIITKLLRTNPNLSGQETIRRRIYDVINVLSAACVIDKVGKQIIWRGGRRSSAPSTAATTTAEEDESRILSKEKVLRDKVTLLTRYKALIRRNFVRTPSSDAVRLPVILIGIRDTNRTTFTQSLNRCELEIRSSADLSFLEPSDILAKIGLPRDSMRSILELSLDIARFGSQLFLDAEEADE